MRKRVALSVLLALALVTAPGRWLPPAMAQQSHEEPTSPRLEAPLTILQMNDVYSTVPIDGQGGLARVATLKKSIAAAGRTPLLLLAGDFLSPSVASGIFKGEQMVAALNAAGLDIATLGNHEFDFGTDVLLKRMAEAKWQWVISNVIDTNTNAPVGGAPPYIIRKYGDLTVGFIGLCLNSDTISAERLDHLRLLDPIETAAKYVPQLKREGANVIVALTHLLFRDDRRLVAQVPDIDVIIGGHEHYVITAVENRTLISKAGSDAKTVARLDLNRRDDGTIERFFELIPITSAIPLDPAADAAVTFYESRLSDELNVVVGTSAVGLEANSIRTRGGETNLGDLFAEAMRTEVGAEIAIVNGGSVRGDRVYAAGPLSRRTLLDMHPFSGVVCKVEVSGQVVLAALENGVSRLPQTDGRFPQIAGLTMRVDPKAPAGNRVRDVSVGGRPLDLDRTYTVALTDYQVEGGDGYGMFKDERVLIGPESGPLIATTLEKYVAARGTVSPATDGRITIVR